MRPLLVLFFLSLVSYKLSAQTPVDTTHRPLLNNLSVNFFGDASLISLNYERYFIVGPTFLINSKIGLGFNEEFQICFGGPCLTEKYLTIPHHITFNVGKDNKFLEFGLGGTVIKGNTTEPYFLYPIIGYRKMATQLKRMSFRVYATLPLSGIEGDDILFLPAGISIGLGF